MLQRNQEALIDIVRMELKKQYRMRIQNEDAALSADVKRDTSLDCWRTMHERLRLSTLHADRSSLLAVYCGLFRQFLPELLQVSFRSRSWFLQPSGKARKTPVKSLYIAYLCQSIESLDGDIMTCIGGLWPSGILVNGAKRLQQVS